MLKYALLLVLVWPICHPYTQEDQCGDFSRFSFQQLCKKISENPVIMQIRPDPVLPRMLQVCNKCPSPVEILTSSRNNLRSTTPWSYCLDTDPYRYPQNLVFAMCSCQGCFNFDELKYDMRVVSRNITVKIPVMMRDNLDVPFRECDNKNCKETLFEVPVGCYCHIPILY